MCYIFFLCTSSLVSELMVVCTDNFKKLHYFISCFLMMKMI